MHCVCTLHRAPSRVPGLSVFATGIIMALIATKVSWRIKRFQFLYWVTIVRVSCDNAKALNNAYAYYNIPDYWNHCTRALPRIQGPHSQLNQSPQFFLACDLIDSSAGGDFKFSLGERGALNCPSMSVLATWWQHGEQIIAENTKSLTFDPVLLAKKGAYKCRVRGVDCNQYVDFNVEIEKPTWGMLDGFLINSKDQLMYTYLWNCLVYLQVAPRLGDQPSDLIFV